MPHQTILRNVTQGIPYHTQPYHTIAYHTILHPTIPYHAIHVHTIPNYTIPYQTIPYRFEGCHRRGRFPRQTHDPVLALSFMLHMAAYRVGDDDNNCNDVCWWWQWLCSMHMMTFPGKPMTLWGKTQFSGWLPVNLMMLMMMMIEWS